MSTTYLALLEWDCVAMAYGLIVPDIPGCCAMGQTREEVLENGTEALREWANDIWADDGNLRRPRTEVELRADPTLKPDFNERVEIVELTLTESAP